MATVIAFEPRRFEGAAPHYLEGRPAYAEALFGRVSGLLGFDGRQRLLDVGTGPGQLAIGFAPYFAEAVAIDPEPTMLGIAGEQAERAGVRLTLLEGSSYALGAQLGRFELVTFGRSFHWTDRHATLRTLDGLVTAAGAVALFATRHPKLPENAWIEDFDALRETYAEPNSHRPLMRRPDWLPHEAVFLDSAFSMLQRISIIERRSTPLEQLVARFLSLSSTSAGRASTPPEDLARAVREALSKYAVDGRIAEVIESEALLATRPR